MLIMKSGFQLKYSKKILQNNIKEKHGKDGKANIGEGRKGGKERERTGTIHWIALFWESKGLLCIFLI